MRSIFILIILDTFLILFCLSIWIKIRKLEKNLKNKDLDSLNEYLDKIKNVLKTFEEFYISFENDLESKKNEIQSLLTNLKTEIIRMQKEKSEMKEKLPDEKNNNVLKEILKMKNSGFSEREISQKLELPLSEVKIYLTMAEKNK